MRISTFPCRSKSKTEEDKLGLEKIQQCKFEFQFFDIAELHKLAHIEFPVHLPFLTVCQIQNGKYTWLFKIGMFKSCSSV